MAVANSRAYGGGMLVAPAAELDDGLLDVITTADVSKLSFLRGLPDVFKGAHVERPEVSSSRAADVEIEADRPFAVYADGEHVTDLPAKVTPAGLLAERDRATRGVLTSRRLRRDVHHLPSVSRTRRQAIADLRRQARRRPHRRPPQPDQRPGRRHDPAGTDPACAARRMRSSASEPGCVGGSP